MKRILMAVTLLGCMTGLAQADYLIIRVNLGIPPLPPKELPKVGPNDFMRGPGGMQMMIPFNGMNPQMMPPWMQGRRMRPRIGQQPIVKKEDPKTKKGQKLDASKTTPLTIVVFVEYDRPKKLAGDEEKGINYTRIRQKWGYTYLAFDQHIVHLTALRKKDGIAKKYADMKREVNGPGNKTPRKFFELAEWALVHNILDDKKSLELHNVMADLGKMNAKTPITEPDIQAALKAYLQVKEDLQKPVDKDDSKQWKEMLGLRGTSSEHYTLLYDDSASSKQDTASRLNRLEQNFEQFYYWFALRGKVLPMPEKRLITVLAGTPQEFRKLYEAFDPGPIVADAFHDRRDNIVFFSSSRLDSVSDAFNQHVSELMKAGWDFKALLKGQPNKKKTGPENAHAMTMALVHKCLQEESEIASVSHEGTRQLLTAVGFLPRGVHLPEWLQFGLPAVFETPKYDPFTRTGAFYPMFGGPSWTYLVNFKLMDMDKPNMKPDEITRMLRGVITDQPFMQAAQTRRPVDLLFARTMGWSLAYYLAQRNLDGLRRFCQELDSLPRDLDFDDDVYLNCFARAFNLEDANQPGRVDAAKFQRLAADWYQFIAKTTPPPMKETLDEAKKALEEYREKLGAKAKAPGAG